MIDIFTVALESWEDFLTAEMHGICPADISMFQQKNFRVIGIIDFLGYGVAKARIDHQESVGKIQRMSDGMFVEENLLLIFPKLLGNSVEIYDAVVDTLLIRVILTDSETLRYGLKALLEEVHFELKKGAWEDTMIDFVAHEVDLGFLLEKVTETFIEIAMHGWNCSYGIFLACLDERPEIACFIGMVIGF